jgi:DNA repair and recombination protein RAD54B
MFCKWSKKKHKTYEDGILIVQERKAQLKDMTGKDIAKSLLGKEMLISLRDGQTLCFGGKEVEISAPIDEEEYSSGRVFMMNTTTKTTTPLLGTRLKPFVNPSSAPKSLDADQTPTLKPLFDPSAPDALVLFQSTLDTEVSIVVDPFISKHLRPHQREGIKFLFDCVVGNEKQTNRGCILADGKHEAAKNFFDLLTFNPRNGSRENFAMYLINLDSYQARKEKYPNYPPCGHCDSQFSDQKLEERIFTMAESNEN